ncbi:MAG: single-stranded DNA-binding protein [Blastocatellales bacterium]
MTQQATQPQTEKKPLTLEQLVVALGKRLAQFQETVAGILIAGLKTGPELQRPLTAYPEFDWQSIGARVTAKDQWGATVVECYGRQWMRRAPDNKYGVDIWFSSCVGKNEAGDNEYGILIKFSERFADRQVEPIGEKAQAALKRMKGGAR